MNPKETNTVRKNSLFLITLRLFVPAAFIGFLFTAFTGNHRQYSQGIAVAKQDNDEEKDAISMEKFFFDARKNITTNAMDYQSMLTADIADRAMASNSRKHSHSVSSVNSLNWISMGPTNIGGRTRAILIDNTDPTGQTLFAGGVSGGIWKSTNGGGTWGNTFATISFSQNDTLSNINVCSIAQDSHGAIYIGTGEGFSLYYGGEGFSTEMLGGGIFKSTDDGNTWRILPKTVPALNNNPGIVWGFTNRIAVRPDNFQVIYAATNFGIYISHDSGATWRSAYRNTLTKLSGSSAYNTLDLKISKDGSIVVASIDGNGYYCYPETADSIFTLIPQSGAGHLPGNNSRIEFAIAPSDPNRIYASVINASGLFGSGGSGSGIYMTKTASSSGGYWYEIGPGGSESFNPYAGQADYDNALGVSPANEGMVLAGGTQMWEWNQLSSADSIGSWSLVSHYFPYSIDDPFYIHPDEHAIVFDPNNTNVVYVGCDGGIFKSTNILNDVSTLVFQAINRNYDVTQYYTIAYSPEVNYYNVNYGNTTIKEGLGLGGGTQDNGSPYVSGNGGYYLNDASDMSGGDGAGAAVSSLNPNVGYFTSDNGYFTKTGDLGTLSFPTSAYTSTSGYNLGANIDSVYNVAAAAGDVCFVFPVALYENPYDLLNHDSLLYIATEADTVGETIWPVDPNGPTSYPYVLTQSLTIGESIVVPDRVVSRVAVGFSPTYGVWVNGQGACNNTPVWMPIAGPLSTPTAYSGTSPIHCLTWSADGDALFVGTQSGSLFRFSNLNTMIANEYQSAALYYEQGGQHSIPSQVVSTNLAFSGLSGRDILSIATDPQNVNNALVTLGNYGDNAYVYYSTNAAQATPTFTSVQGNLPDMPIYSSVLDIRNSDGSWSNGSAMVATEHGIYTTDNLNGSSTVWVKNSNGLPNVITLAIKQQTSQPWQCNNSGDIYVGTHGRGLWASTTNNQPTAVPTITSPVSLSNLLVYPNPMTNQGNIEFSLASSDNIAIIIYDMQGRKVKTLSTGTQAPGNHIVSFASADLSAGSYFVSLTGTNFRKTAKFVVVK